MKKRGQAALEYLTTYGWVFLVAIIGISTLASFGLLSPSKFIPDRCWFGSQLVCEDYTVRKLSSTQSQFFIRLRNNFAKDIRVLDVKAVEALYPISLCNTPVDISVGAVQEVNCIIGQELFQGDKYSIPLLMTFQRNESVTAPNHTIGGEVYTKVI